MLSTGDLLSRIRSGLHASCSYTPAVPPSRCASSRSVSVPVLKQQHVSTAQHQRHPFNFRRSTGALEQQLVTRARKGQQDTPAEEEAAEEDEAGQAVEDDSVGHEGEEEEDDPYADVVDRSEVWAPRDRDLVDDEDEDGHDEDLTELNQYYDMDVIKQKNVNPDYFDEDWMHKVDDWAQFWNYSKWDEEAAGLEEQLDVGGNPVNHPARIAKMIQALQDIQGLPNVIGKMGIIEGQDHRNYWQDPPSEPVHGQAYWRKLSISDATAIADKKLWRDYMDMEWRRRQSLIGTVQYPHMSYERDVRMQRFGPEREWTDEEVYQLITLNGLAARPEDVPHTVLNPLVPVDWVQDKNAPVCNDTEEFIDEIGRLASPEAAADFGMQYEVSGPQYDMLVQRQDAILHGQDEEEGAVEEGDEDDS